MQARLAEVDQDERQRDPRLGGRVEQRLLHAVSLALYAVDQHAPRLPVADAAELEHVLWRVGAALGGIGGREQLVPCPASRLQAPDPANGGMLGDGSAK